MQRGDVRALYNVDPGDVILLLVILVGKESNAVAVGRPARGGIAMSARGQGSIVRSVEINDPKIGAPPVGEHVAELAHISNSATIRRDLRIDSILEVENVRGRQAIGFLLGHCAHLKDGKRDAGCQQNFFPGIKHLHSSASLGLKSGNLTSHTHWARKVFPSMQGRPGRTIWQLALVCVIFVSISHAARGQAESPQPLSFLELIANPNKFDGKLIFVTAFLGLDPPDGNMLYLHKEDYDNGILLNAVSIEVTKQMRIDSE